jgi:hypothetical protein
MTVRQRKTLIWLAAGVLAAPTVAVVALGLALPVRVETGAAGRPDGGAAGEPSDRAASAADRDRQRRAAVADLLRLCRTDLRKPLFDSEAPAEGPTAKGGTARRGGPSSLTLRLIGTVNEPGHSMAMFQKKDGSIALCAQGESVDDAGGAVTVTRVEFEKVTVQYGNRSHELILPPRRTPMRASPATKGK